MYAPFVKAADKVKKDVAELSLSDFHPKRFALNYDPPMISKYTIFFIKSQINTLNVLFLTSLHFL